MGPFSAGGVGGQAPNAEQGDWACPLQPCAQPFFRATWMAGHFHRREGNVTGDMVLKTEMWAPLEDSPLFLSFPSEEVAFRKKRLCIKFIPRDSTEAAICDIRIMGRTKQAPPQYTFIG